MGKKRITKMDLDEISMVSRGDDPEADIVISKAAPEKSTSSGDHSATLTGTRSVQTTEVHPDMADEFNIHKEDLPSDEWREYVEGLEEIAVDALGLSEDGEIEDDYDDDFEVWMEEEPVLVGKSASEEDIFKAHPELAERIAKAEQDAEEAIAKAEAEEDKRIHREMIDKAATMPHLGTGVEEMADLLFDLEKSDPDLADRVVKVFRSSSARLENADLFDEIGKSGEGAGDSVLEGAVTEIMKADGELTREQAIVKAMELNPSLYDNQIKEH